MPERKITVRAERPPKGITGRCPCTQFKEQEQRALVEAREYLKSHSDALSLLPEITAKVCEPYGLDMIWRTVADIAKDGSTVRMGQFRCYLWNTTIK